MIGVLLGNFCVIFKEVGFQYKLKHFNKRLLDFALPEVISQRCNVFNICILHTKWYFFLLCARDKLWETTVQCHWGNIIKKIEKKCDERYFCGIFKVD